jgi:subtilisin family serine protease
MISNSVKVAQLSSNSSDSQLADISSLFVSITDSTNATEVFKNWKSELASGAFLKTIEDELFWLADENMKNDSAFQYRNREWASIIDEWKINDKFCDFSKIRSETLKSGIVISNLFEAFSSAVADKIDSCILSLVIFLSIQAETIHISFVPKIKVHNVHASWIVQSGELGKFTLYSNGITGAGEIIGVADTGLDVNSCFFKDPERDPVSSSSWAIPTTDLKQRKVVQYIAYADESDVTSGHGTHVSGTLAGSSISADAADYNGVAYNSKIAFFDIGLSQNDYLQVPTDLEGVLLPPSYEIGSRIHSVSWGSSDSIYSVFDQSFDRYVFDHPDMVIVVAAGNCGEQNAACQVSGFGSIGSPALAKNVISVGASLNYPANTQFVAAFSSRGPTPDGRIKPDVVAPGHTIFSAAASGNSDSTCATVGRSGTSMATPAVAGSVALIREYFAKGYYPSGYATSNNAYNPSAALVKAVLINSAEDVIREDGSILATSNAPDAYQGFGLVSLENSLNFAQKKTMFVKDRAELTQGKNFTLKFLVVCTSEPIRITLAWTDPPATIGTAKNLVNDLDLVVVLNNSSTKYYPNGLDQADSLNNVEKIIIPAENLVAGQEYTIYVQAVSLNSNFPKQRFALVASGCFYSASVNVLPKAATPITLNFSFVILLSALMMLRALFF